MTGVQTCALPICWHRFVGTEGDVIGVDTFGASAPGGVCLEKFGFTVDNVLAKAKALLG